MLDFESFCFYLAEIFRFELMFQFIARVSTLTESIHYGPPIDISITWKKPVNGKFTATFSNSNTVPGGQTKTIIRAIRQACSVGGEAKAKFRAIRTKVRDDECGQQPSA
ncbi:hypothetical protein Y032_0021g417 [Ancylostoma ceylanicum]|uniref:Uncharacterized protein n=1 Tax=Ancylostoma ceylanicum TaxID=53326 RepID=A0A016V0J3_9BILA|nr:hypothetical protein Y032_0021g417 [Ancylostoma ceylanicum]